MTTITLTFVIFSVFSSVVFTQDNHGHNHVHDHQPTSTDYFVINVVKETTGTEPKMTWTIAQADRKIRDFNTLYVALHTLMGKGLLSQNTFTGSGYQGLQIDHVMPSHMNNMHHLYLPKCMNIPLERAIIRVTAKKKYSKSEIQPLLDAIKLCP